MKKTCVLLLQLGTPDSPKTSDVRRYLSEFLNDPRVIDIPSVLRAILVNGIIVPFRAPKSAKIYKELWELSGGMSPLLTHTQNVTRLLQEEYNTDEVTVEFAMRYQNPSMDSVMERIRQANYDRIVLFPQQNGSMTFVDSIAQKTLIGQYCNQQIRLEGAYIWEMNAGDRWAFSAGAGVSFGLSYRSITQVVYLENTNSYQGFNGTQGTQTHHTQTETFNNPMAFGANLFVPLGIQFQLGNKRPFWMPWMLYTEFRPQVALHSIPTLGLSFCPGIGATGGIRYNLPSRLGAAHLRYEEF